MGVNRTVILDRMRKVAEFARTRDSSVPLVLDDAIADLADELEDSEDQDSGSRNGDTEPSRLTTPFV